MTWEKFGKLSQYLQNRKFQLALKKKSFMQSVIPALLQQKHGCSQKTLGCEMRSTQIKMERKMLRVTWREKITNNTIKEKTKLPGRTA